jgi:integrase
MFIILHNKEVNVHMGHLRKRGPKKYQIVIEVEPDPETGKRNFIYKTVNCKKPKAGDIMQDMEKDLREGTYVDTDMTLEEHLQDFLKSQKKKLKPRTYNSYKMIINKHIIPELGHYKLLTLVQKPKLINDYYDLKLEKGNLVTGQGLSNRTVRYHHSVLKRAFHVAIKWHRMKINPADLVDQPEKIDKEAKYLTVNQLNEVLELENIKYYERIYRFAARTGMRKGEILGLEWSEIDFDKEVIKVKQTLQRVEDKGLVIQEWTKNKLIRDIPLSIKTKSILKQIKAEQSKTKLLLNKKNKYDLVFAKENKKPATPNYVYRRFKKHCRKAGYNDINFHSLRHTFGSLLKQNGVDLKTIQELLGHKTREITSKIYTHISVKNKKEAAEKIDQIF